MKRLRVFGGSFDGTLRHLIGAFTQKQACELATSFGRHMSAHYFREYWVETGNQKELDIVTTPGVWEVQDTHGKTPKFKKLKKEAKP